MRKNTRNVSTPSPWYNKSSRRPKRGHPGMQAKGLLAAIIACRPHERFGGCACVKVNDGSKTTQNVYEYHTAKGSNTRTGRTYRHTKRRCLKRMEEREALKDIASQIADNQEETMEIMEQDRWQQEEYLRIEQGLLDDLLDTLVPAELDLHLYVDDTQIAVATSDISPCDDPSYLCDPSEQLALAAAHRHTSCLIPPPQAVSDDPAEPSDIPAQPQHPPQQPSDPDTQCDHLSDLRANGVSVGSKLAKSGRVYGKVRRAA